jgi:hypothetical protein
MTRNDIIKMAREAGWEYANGDSGYEPLWRFARLIEKHLYYDGIHTCNDECQRPACVAIRKAVKREREACATIAEFNMKAFDHAIVHERAECAQLVEQAGIDGYGTLAAAAMIRARGNQ